MGRTPWGTDGEQLPGGRGRWPSERGLQASAGAAPARGAQGSVSAAACGALCSSGFARCCWLGHDVAFQMQAHLCFCLVSGPEFNYWLHGPFCCDSAAVSLSSCKKCVPDVMSVGDRDKDMILLLPCLYPVPAPPPPPESLASVGISPVTVLGHVEFWTSVRCFAHTHTHTPPHCILSTLPQLGIIFLILQRMRRRLKEVR